MSPQLFHRQIEDGAWGITLVTVDQIQVARATGLRRPLQVLSEGGVGGRRAGCREVRFIVASWCRRAVSSSWSAARPRKQSRGAERTRRKSVAHLPRTVSSPGPKSHDLRGLGGFQEARSPGRNYPRHHTWAMMDFAPRHARNQSIGN
jgi:hypothetical protein